jgi:YHS domain-containing protein
MKGLLVIVATMVMLCAGCASHDHSHHHPTTALAAGDTVNAMCAVNPHDAVSPQYFSIYQGKKVGFCCPDCKASFDKDPAKYMANLK